MVVLQLKKTAKVVEVKRKKMKERSAIVSQEGRISNSTLESVNMEMLIAVLWLNLKKMQIKI